MTMRSIDLLPALRELPASESRERMSFRDMMAGLVNTDRAMFAAEFSSTMSLGLWAIFPGVNVDDDLREMMNQAYRAQYRNEAANQSLHEKWQEMAERGAESEQGFLSGLKGKAAEFHTKELLEDRGYTNVRIAPNPTQEGWDISAIGPEGQDALTQVKTGTSLSAGDVQALMEEHPNVLFALGSELHEKVAATGMDTSQIFDIGSDYERVQGIKDGLETLSANEGIDVPDGIVGIVPYAATIVGGARLIHSVLKTEREFRAADRTTRNRIQVVQTLTLMSRMGINTVLAMVGGMGGTAVGSSVPGVGNVVGGIGGLVGGAVMGMRLNKRLQPRMLDLALDITGLTHDDLFYYKNKPRIDAVALSFQTRAGELAAAPSF